MFQNRRCTHLLLVRPMHVFAGSLVEETHWETHPLLLPVASRNVSVSCGKCLRFRYGTYGASFALYQRHLARNMALRYRLRVSTSDTEALSKLALISRLTCDVRLPRPSCLQIACDFQKPIATKPTRGHFPHRATLQNGMYTLLRQKLHLALLTCAITTGRQTPHTAAARSLAEQIHRHRACRHYQA